MVGVILILGSWLGWHLWLVRRTNLPLSVLPMVLVVTTVAVGYAAAMIGVLELSFDMMLLSGYVLGGVALFGRSTVRRKTVEWLPQIALTVCGVVVVWMMQGAVVTGYDDFSHWYRICKIMHYDGRLPATPDLSYRSYVPGLAIWISFVVHFVQFNPANCFIAQRMLELSLLCVLFLPFERESDCRWRLRLFFFLFWFMLVVLSGSVGGGVYNLLADRAVALAGAALSILVYCERKKGELLVPVVLLCVLCALVKTTSLIFLVVIVPMYAARLSAGRTLRWKLLSHFCWMGGLLIYLSYLVYIRIHYPGARAMGAHVFPNAALWYSRLAECSGQAVVSLIHTFGSALFDFKRFESILLSAGIVLLLTCLCVSKNHRFWALHILLGVVWVLGLFLTYLLQMSPAERICLASFGRYLSSIGLFLFLVGSCGIVHFFVDDISKNRRSIFTLVIAAGVALMVFLRGSYSYLGGYKCARKTMHCTDTLWRCLEASIQERMHYTGGRYRIVYDDHILNSPADTIQRISNACALWLRTSANNINLIADSVYASGPKERADVDSGTIFFRLTCGKH